MAFSITPLVPCKRQQRWFLNGLVLAAVPLFLLSTGALTQNNSSSSGGHAGAPSFSASVPSAHVSASAGTGFSGSLPHSPGSSGHHANGNGNPRPKPHPQGSGSIGEVYYYPYWYPVPYVVDSGDNADTSDDAEDDADYQGGPTVFDRRGSGAASYVPPVDSGPAHPQADEQASNTTAPDADATPEPAPEPTILVFKDGHQMQVENYAVISQTLYDLTPGHRRKIALADLDLPATEQQNEDHGIMFLLPSSSGQAN